VRAKAGLPEVWFNDLRHTCLTLPLNLGHVRTSRRR